MTEERIDLFKKEIREPNRMFKVGTLIDGLIDYEGISGEVLLDYEEYQDEVNSISKEDFDNWKMSKEGEDILFFPVYYFFNQRKDEYQLLSTPYEYTKRSKDLVEDNNPLVYPKLNSGEYAPIYVIHPRLNFPIIIGSISLVSDDAFNYYTDGWDELFEQIEENADCFYYLDETNTPTPIININELGQTLVIDNDLTEPMYLDSELEERILVGCVRDGGILLGYNLLDESIAEGLRKFL